MNRLMNISRLALSGVAALKVIRFRVLIPTRHSIDLHGLQQKLGFHSHSIKMYADQPTSPPARKGPESQLLLRLSNHPHIMQQLLDFIAFLQTKGLDPSSKKIDYFKAMKLAKDPEVQQKGQELSAALKIAGIHLDKTTIYKIRELLLNKTLCLTESPLLARPEDTKTHDINSKDQHNGLLNRIKHLFM